MAQTAESIRDRQERILNDWREATIRMLDRRIRQTKGMKLSDSQRQNIFIEIIENAEGWEVPISFRDSIRFQDMGAGKGYHKGVRLSASNYDAALTNHRPRRQKVITNKPVFARLHWLEEVMGGVFEKYSVIQSEKVVI